MNKVDEFARIRAEIRRLEVKAKAMRRDFLQGGALRSNQHEVIIKQQKRRTLCKARLPQSILNDPEYWRVSVSNVVLVQPLKPATQASAREDEFEVLEAF